TESLPLWLGRGVPNSEAHSELRGFAIRLEKKNGDNRMKDIKTEVHSFVLKKVISRFGPALLALVFGAGLCTSMVGIAAAQGQEQGNNSEPGMHRHGHHKMPSVDDQVK